MLILLHVKHHKDHTYQLSDFVSNRNVEITLVNTRYVKEVKQFDEKEILDIKPYKDYLYGSKSVLWFDYNNSIHVIESFEEIKNKLGIN